MTFECDTPREARERTIVSTTAIPEGLAPHEIDAFVSRAVAAGEDLYHLDSGALSALDADLVVTQDLCAVCAVDVSVVDDALAYLGCRADVLTIDPHTLDEVLASVRDARRRQRLRRHRSGARGATCAGAWPPWPSRCRGAARPRALVLEWTDPAFAPGHWVPEMVTVAGGTNALGDAGEKSVRVTWDAVRDSAPEVIVCAPCGYDLEGLS